MHASFSAEVDFYLSNSIAKTGHDLGLHYQRISQFGHVARGRGAIAVPLLHAQAR
jgi:hypothetical protein